MRQLDGKPAIEHGAVRTILEAKAKGYKTILTFKYHYNRVPFPKAGAMNMRARSRGPTRCCRW
ncbi:hypothetical protein [Sphingomonas sp. J315]|uniref:hypothetical protein n=1 Tax=Sphingomonas sp. J315 TaxID=2898433 RepID=UPI0021AE1AB1|nr:hypothetical protein [Sphingomonas sp. J315]UUX98872.1 hypothetical protein LRS08_15375 [Sphingomonas sp. J315]